MITRPTNIAITRYDSTENAGLSSIGQAMLPMIDQPIMTTKTPIISISFWQPSLKANHPKVDFDVELSVLSSLAKLASAKATCWDQVLNTAARLRIPAQADRVGGQSIKVNLRLSLEAVVPDQAV